MAIDPIEVDGQLARIETALNAALNMVEGDGMPPDWDYLRLIRSQLPDFRQSLIEIQEQAWRYRDLSR